VPITLHPPFRRATPDDAAPMAELMNMAGEGIPLLIWSGLAEPGQSPWQAGQQRARREDGGFSYRNAVLLEAGGKVASALISYALPDEPESFDPAQMPPLFVPLAELEAEAAGSWYINVLATFPQHRGKGHGAALIARAEEMATAAGKPALSLIVSDANAGARRLYERLGFRVTASRPAMKEGPNGETWENPCENWLLMIEDL
jgi:ribosomal protein S18 acetylase RimI-like enzyme